MGTLWTSRWCKDKRRFVQILTIEKGPDKSNNIASKGYPGMISSTYNDHYDISKTGDNKRAHNFRYGYEIWKPQLCYRVTYIWTCNTRVVLRRLFHSWRGWCYVHEKADFAMRAPQKIYAKIVHIDRGWNAGWCFKFPHDRFLGSCSWPFAATLTCVVPFTCYVSYYLLHTIDLGTLFLFRRVFLLFSTKKSSLMLSQKMCCLISVLESWSQSLTPFSIWMKLPMHTAPWRIQPIRVK